MNKVDIKLINAFLERDRQNIKADLESYKDLYCAATSYNSSNIKHGHQRRINPNILKEFAQKVLEKETELENAKSFDDIYTIIKSCKIYNIGRLAIYDTAIRIAYLKGLKYICNKGLVGGHINYVFMESLSTEINLMI